MRRRKLLLILLGLLIFIFFIMPLSYKLMTGDYPPGHPWRKGNEFGTQNTTAQISLILPLKATDATSKDQGIWPFGVRGGDHPHGHPGIDFEAMPGAPILAVVDGSVGDVGNVPVAGEEKSKRISISFKNGTDMFDIFYVGSMKNILVKRGDRVTQGQIIAYFDRWEGKGRILETGSIHFELFRLWPMPIGSTCPVTYFTPQARQEIETLFAQSKYKERQEFPLLCNSCPSGGCR